MTVVEVLMIIMVLSYSVMIAVNAVIASFSDSFLTFSVFDLYHETKMNWFGCTLTWIGIVIINPYWWLIYAPVYYICVFFKWLFTVGRK